MFGGPRYLDACRRRYGDAVTFRRCSTSGFVMVFDPELVKQVFQGSNEQLHAGEANALLGPILGERSVLLLDGAEHSATAGCCCHPSTAGGCGLRGGDARLRRCRDRRLADRRAVHAADQHAVADAAGDPARRVRLRAGRRRGGARAAAAGDGRAAGTAARAADALRASRGGATAARRGVRGRKRAVDEILFAEIARRRAEPDLPNATTCSRRCCWPRTRTASG